MIAELVSLCKVSQVKLCKLSVKFQSEANSFSLEPRNIKFKDKYARIRSSNLLKRDTKLITGIAIGVLTSFVSSFTSSKRFGMSLSDHYIRSEENQVHMITGIQSQESLIIRDQCQILQMREHLENLGHKQANLISLTNVFAEATSAAIVSRDFSNYVTYI